MISTFTFSQVRSVMRDQKVSGRELARRLGMTHTAVARRLSGETEFKASEIGAVASALGVPIASLIDSSGAAAPSSEAAAS